MGEVHGKLYFLRGKMHGKSAIPEENCAGEREKIIIGKISGKIISKHILNKKSPAHPLL